MISNLRQGLRLVPSTLRRPELAGRWLAGAHRTQLVLVVTGALALFSLPPLLDWLLPRVYPPVRARYSVPGIPALSTSRPDPRVADRREQLMLAVWIAWLGAAVVLMLAELPRAAKQLGDGEAGPRLARPEATVIEPPPRASAAVEPSAAAGATAPVAAGSPASAAPVIASGDPKPGDSGVGRMGPANRYRLTRELGRGGMGVVYHAVDTVLQREVALKELPLHLGGRTELADRFRQEARVLARLSHPNIVQVHDLIEEDGRLWIALEFVRGGTLGQAMAECGGALPWPVAVAIARQIASGLGFAHSQGVIHRDVKPINILLTGAETPVAKLTDFGLARLVESTEHTQPGSLLGSAKYMSPEQVAGRPADARSDLYAFGVTLFEMLSGAAPFEGEFAVVLSRHANEAAPDLRERVPGAPEELAQLVAAMLAKDPDARPADADAVARALEAIAGREDSIDRAA